MLLCSNVVGKYASLPLCHLYINNQLSGSQNPSIIVILATIVSYFLLKMTQWLDSESDLHFLCSDAGFLAEKPASLKHKYGIQLFLCSDAGILARKPASLQGNFKVPKNMDFLGDFAQFRRASSTQRARTTCFVPTSTGT